MTDATDNSAAWRPDPTGRHAQRWFDGTKWTEHVADVHGTTSTDPYDAGAAGEAPAGADGGPPAAAGTPTAGAGAGESGGTGVGEAGGTSTGPASAATPMAGAAGTPGAPGASSPAASPGSTDPTTVGPATSGAQSDPTTAYAPPPQPEAPAAGGQQWGQPAAPPPSQQPWGSPPPQAPTPGGWGAPQPQSPPTQQPAAGWGAPQPGQPVQGWGGQPQPAYGGAYGAPAGAYGAGVAAGTGAATRFNPLSAIVVAAGAVLAVVGLFALKWVHVPGNTSTLLDFAKKSGGKSISDIGDITFMTKAFPVWGVYVAVVVALGAAIVSVFVRQIRVVAVVLCVLAAAWCLWFGFDMVHWFKKDRGVSGSVQIGAWLAFAGFLVAAIGCLLPSRRRT